MIDLKEIFKLLFTLLTLSLIVLLCSCSTRKVQKSSIKEETKTEQSTTENKDIEIKTDTQTVINAESQEIEITPIDTAKVLIINGKTYKNAKVKFISKKINTTIAKKKTIKDKTQTQIKAITAAKKQVKTKDIEKKSNPFTPLLWLLIPAVGYLIWKYKYKIVGL